MYLLGGLVVLVLILLYFHYNDKSHEGYINAGANDSGLFSRVMNSVLGKSPANPASNGASNAASAGKCGPGAEGLNFGKPHPNQYNPRLSNGSLEAQTNALMGEQAEYFQTCEDNSEVKNALDCACEGNPGLFAKSEWGGAGDYKEFVTSQAVDDQVIVNHANYIKDRKQFGVGGEMTGRTYSPDSHDSYDPIPWIGLRRPQYVEMCNPTQVPDVDVNLYKGNRQFCFRT